MARTTSAGSSGRPGTSSSAGSGWRSASSPSASANSSSGSVMSALVVVDGACGDARPLPAVDAVLAQPAQLDLAERVGLVEVDQALLEELQEGQEAHDDLEALDQAVGQAAEGDPP